MLQMAEWEDKEAAAKALSKLGRLPPLVQPAEVDSLKQRLAAAGRGEAFVVQGGDCAERFDECEGERLETQAKLMIQLGLIVKQVLQKPPVVVCRIAGQYGKPRSSPTEKVEGVGEVMSFKGDNINGLDLADRKWDPNRLVQGYFHSAATLNFLRSFLQTADQKTLAAVNMAALAGAPDMEKIQASVTTIESSAISGISTEFFTAHEGMQLDLEEALTRSTSGRFYNLSAHMLWIGERTRQLDGGHVEYFRGISNPVGLKIGPTMKPEELGQLVQILNPNNEEGRLVLITRFGAGKIDDVLPGQIEAVKASGVPVVWQCDPMHGNGMVASNKLKTRDCAAILSELLKAVAIHKRCGSVLGGIHLECTGQAVTECLGGCVGLTEEGLRANYATACDPRLNYAQAIEIVHRVAEEASA